MNTPVDYHKTRKVGATVHFLWHQEMHPLGGCANASASLDTTDDPAEVTCMSCKRWLRKHAQVYNAATVNVRATNTRS